MIHDARIPEEYISRLKEKLPEALLLPFSGESSENNSVYESIRCHPDIYFFQLDTKSLIHACRLKGSCLSFLRKHGIRLVSGKSDPSKKYPDTVPFNAMRVGNYLLHNLDYTDPVILENARNHGLKNINIKQGYARCSIVNVGDKAIITSDNGMTKQAREHGFDVLLVSPGDVLLPGEKYGLLGGASGNLSDGTIVFLGDIRLHPEAKRITEFFKKHETEYIDLKGLPLYDAGGLLVISNK
ncbi:MAG: DUF6873 family GME fold protein [Candidatus Omnitrophota bacterium]